MMKYLSPLVVRQAYIQGFSHFRIYLIHHRIMDFHCMNSYRMFIAMWRNQEDEPKECNEYI